MPIRLLFSARDPGAVGFLVPIIDACKLDNRFALSIIASEPALHLLRSLGKSVADFPATKTNSNTKIESIHLQLVSDARFILEQTKPDVVITSSSSQGVGIDEALLAASNVPTITIQDFWGDVNLGLNSTASIYLVIDEMAANMSKERWGVSTIAVGSCKYTRYEQMNIDALRSFTRLELGLAEDQLLVGFFGQNPEIPGHEEAFRDLIRVLSKMTTHPTLLIREHPKFPNNTNHDGMLNEMGITAINVTNKGEVEPWLSACDIVTTCYSYVSIDHAYLSSKAHDPIGTVLFLLHHKSTRQYMKQTTGLSSLPTVIQGIGSEAKHKDDIKSLLTKADVAHEKLLYHKASQKLKTENCVPRILDIIAKTGNPL